MHPALLIPELITIIAHMSQRGDACRMTRTCRAWHPVALDRVWQQNDFVDSINVLLNTLPTDVYQPYKSWHRGKPVRISSTKQVRASTDPHESTEIHDRDGCEFRHRLNTNIFTSSLRVPGA